MTTLKLLTKKILFSWFPWVLRRNERQLLHFYQQLIAKNDLCFDVGANIGQMTNTFLILGARVVAIEPQMNCIEKLKTKFGDSITIVDKAIGSIQGSGILNVSDKDELSTLDIEFVNHYSGQLGLHKWHSRKKVAITTLDRLINQYGHPNFCKIDVEGYELEVLRGLSTAINYISFEFHDSLLEKTEQCIQEISRLGEYEFNFSTSERNGFDLNSWVSQQKIIRELTQASKGGNVYSRLRPDKIG